MVSWQRLATPLGVSKLYSSPFWFGGNLVCLFATYFGAFYM
ncbi:hypothetical protein COLO4_04604 [Corchorus olitorius]|uniref:Uncharacterized protein n=1 Tax=Corchorus olitorius TaxID=93759 RepID=A0A1R3KTF7_9ROSI|nr:hypothetical protein COLO4_04604 [Corchorus olitorius]